MAVVSILRAFKPCPISVSMYWPLQEEKTSMRKASNQNRIDSRNVEIEHIAQNGVHLRSAGRDLGEGSGAKVVLYGQQH